MGSLAETPYSPIAGAAVPLAYLSATVNERRMEIERVHVGFKEELERCLRTREALMMTFAQMIKQTY